MIVNDLIDLNGVDVELVSGFPHLRHAHVTSSLWTQDLATFLNQLRNSNPSQWDGGLASNQFMLQNAYAPVRRPVDTGIPATPLAGESTEDLYFYPLDNVKLAKGERGYYQLFSAKVPYQHCYTWDIADFVDAGSRYRQQNQDKAEIVWHAISLTNTTSLPWTTAPGQTIKAGRVLGQDTVHYTSPGTATDLRVTQALGIFAEQNEYEQSRQRNAERFHGSTYDLVTVRGELALTNHKGKDRHRAHHQAAQR